MNAKRLLSFFPHFSLWFSSNFSWMPALTSHQVAIVVVLAEIAVFLAPNAESRLDTNPQ